VYAEEAHDLPLEVKSKMPERRRILPRLVLSVAAPILLFATLAGGQKPPASQGRSVPPAQPAERNAGAPIPTDKDVAATQSELIKLLRLSPTLTTVVARDPSLLSNQDYVSRNNPQLAEFLASHPEVARNPEFYLFSHMDHADGSADEALERAVWRDSFRPGESPSMFREFFSDLAPLLAFACFLAALAWLIRVVVENRRWGRIFRLQSEVHGRLIDKFSSNQELALYMETEAGRKFLEAAPIPVAFEPRQHVPNALARVLTPLQIGIVLVLLGIGLLFLRHASLEMERPMLVLGIVTLMPGLGFIISAGITWILAGRLGLMPQAHAAADKIAAPFDSSDRQ
jgi:hypothetical protein